MLFFTPFILIKINKLLLKPLMQKQQQQQQPVDVDNIRNCLEKSAQHLFLIPCQTVIASHSWLVLVSSAVSWLTSHQVERLLYSVFKLKWSCFCLSVCLFVLSAFERWASFWRKVSNTLFFSGIFVCLSVCLSVCPSVFYSSVWLSVCLCQPCIT